MNEFNSKEELEAFGTAIKEVYFQEYKTQPRVIILAIQKKSTNHTLNS